MTRVGSQRHKKKGVGGWCKISKTGNMYIEVRFCNTDGVSPLCFRKLIFKCCIIKMYAAMR